MTIRHYYEDGGVTIYHGDIREAPANFFEFADVLVTDPPYGIGYSSSHGGKFSGSKIANDDSTALRDHVLTCWGSRPAIVFGSWKVEKPRDTKTILVWDKGVHVGMGDLRMPWKPNFELIYILGEGFRGKRTSGVLRYNAPSPNFAEQLHATEKPEPLLRELIGKCPPGIIIDPFIGSGTILRVAKDHGRRAIGCDIEERNCETAAKRLAQGALF